MTSRPRIATDVNYVNGVAAVALFAVLAWTFVTTELKRPMGFGDGSIVASIGYAMFDLLSFVPSGHGETEGFLIAFLTVAVVLDAALDGAVMLARREEDGSVVTALTDGGVPVDRTDGTRASNDGTGTPGPDEGTGTPGSAGETDPSTGGGED